MRRMIAFSCAGETLVGTLDVPPAGARAGLLIVSGGNEIRIGAHRGMALLAQRLASAGIAVFRFDRRGIGDSTGENLGFTESAADITAATAALRDAVPGLTHVTAFGNCDAATALAMFHQQARIDALILSNPWPGDEEDDLPPAPAIAAHYAEKIKQPGQWARLITGKVNILKLFGGLFKIFRSKTKTQPQELPPLEDGEEAPTPLVIRYAPIMAASLSSAGTPTTILLAGRDNTAIAFRDDWRKLADADAYPLALCDSDSHSYSSAADKQWLFERVLKTVQVSRAPG